MTNLINEKDEFNGEKNISRKILIKNGFTSDKVCEIYGLLGEILSMRI